MAKKRNSTHPAGGDRIAEPLRALAVPIGDLVPDPENARTHDEANIRAIAASLKRFGQVKPIVANRHSGRSPAEGVSSRADDGGKSTAQKAMIIAGHGTLEAAKSLEWTHLAVVYVELSAGEAHGLAIADNRTAELSGWDQARLDAQILELADEGEAAGDFWNDLQMIDLVLEAANAATPESPTEAVGGWNVVVECADKPQQLEICELLKTQGVKFHLQRAKKRKTAETPSR